MTGKWNACQGNGQAILPGFPQEDQRLPLHYCRLHSMLYIFFLIKFISMPIGMINDRMIKDMKERRKSKK